MCRSHLNISALDAFCEDDERENRYIEEVLARYRGEDAGDLKRSVSDVLVEHWTRLNAPREEHSKRNLMILRDEKSWKTWKSNQKGVMDEELVQNGVMDGKFGKNFVLGTKN